MARGGNGRDAPAGDDEGFARWASLRRNQLRRTAYLLCGDWAGADDLVQETLVRTYVRWRRVATGNPDGYAQRALTSAFIDDRRRPWRRERPRESLPEHEAATYDPGLHETGLAAALRTVPARQRAAIVLRYWEDLSVEQTAELMGCSPGAVKSQSSRGLARLREALAEPPPPIPLSTSEVLR
jgi:RNA polymerase sigma-70 factor (sigma-E family)